MTALRVLMLLAAVAICYLLFSRSLPTPTATPGTAPHSQYKQEMDQAHAAARQMQIQRKEADQP